MVGHAEGTGTDARRDEEEEGEVGRRRGARTGRVVEVGDQEVLEGKRRMRRRWGGWMEFLDR